MSGESENRKKIFKKFFDLPSELRMMIIDEMETEDRCRFTECSKLCNKEAKTSKKYMHGMQIQGFNKNSLRIFFKFREFKKISDRRYGFILKFEQSTGHKYMKYLNIDTREELWSIELDISTDVLQYATEQFKTRLQTYQKIIKQLSINGLLLNFAWANNLEINSLNRLEHLTVHSDVDIRYFLSKIKHPLLTLQVCGRENGENLGDCEQIYQVENILTLNAELNNVQFSRLSTRRLHMSAENLTQDDIFNFVRSWQNGTIGKRVDSYTFTPCRFNIPQLLRRLEVGDGSIHEFPAGSDCYHTYEIRQFNDARKTANLVYQKDVKLFGIDVRHVE